MSPERQKKLLEDSRQDLADCIDRLDKLITHSTFTEYTKNKLRKIKTDVQDEHRQLSNFFQYELKLGGEDKEAY